MAFNPQDILKFCKPESEEAGKTLLVLNALGMVFAAASNTFAAAIDKNTSAEDKKFLVPAGAATGVANIALYYAMTNKIRNKLEESAKNTVKKMGESDLTQKATTLAQNMVKKADKKIFKGKDHENYVKSMKETLFKNGDVNGEIKDYAKTLYKTKTVASASVLGSFVGAVVGCAILTPIIRDVSAYFVQKQMEKRNPKLKTEPYKPYINVGPMNANAFQKQPLTMKSYMSTTSSSLKI